MEITRARHQGWSAVRVVSLGIALVAFIAFSPALRNEFVEWDDPVLFTRNEAYRGLGWTQISWMFSNILMGHYVPVTWLTLGLDYVLWGMDPAGYHFTNLLLHAANAALFYFLARRLLAAATSFAPAILRLAAAASALFFALHPLRAESVAWVTERRDVLSGVFFFLTLLAYLRASDAHGRRRRALHAVTLACFLLAILSKSIVMTLPALLVLLDVYPFRRFTPEWRPWASPTARTLWREKVPYLALGLLAAMLGYYGQAANQYFTSRDQIGWSARPWLVFYSLWFYVSKTALPLGLGPLYEMPAQIDPLEWRFLGPTLGVIALTLIFVLARRRWPAGLAVWLSYAILLSPVMGLTHAGHQLAHDRYSYLSCLGWALLAGAAAGALVVLWQRGTLRPSLARLGGAAALVWFAGLGVLSWQQVQTWRDTETLWQFAIESSPDCSVCELNLGVSLLRQNLLPGAQTHFERALDQRPDRVKIHQNIGLVFAQRGDMPQAVEHFRRVVERRPDDVPTLMNLGVALMKMRRHAEGLTYLQRAMLLRPDDYLVLSNLGIALTETGKPLAAVALFKRAIELKPDAVEPRHGLFLVHLALGHADAAQVEHQALRALSPALAKFLAPALLAQW